MSNSKQTFRVTATPRERFQLALLLFKPELKQRTIRDGEAMYRARKNLGLLGISDLMLEAGVADEMARDRTTRNVFTVTHADAEYVLAAREKVELEPPAEHMLMPLLLQLRTAKDSGIDAEDADTALPFDEAAELPRWKRSLRPALLQPEKFLDVFGDLLGRAALREPSLRELHDLFMAATAEPDKPDEAPRPNGHPLTSASPPA